MTDVPYVRGSDTSQDAALSMEDSVGAIRERVFRYVERSPGLTCDEIETRMGLRHQTASARLRELVLAGRIHDTLKRRPTRSGRMAAIYRVGQAPRPVERDDLFSGL